MVFSYYLTKYPYQIIWNCLKWMNKTDGVVFYCGNELDLHIFAPVQKFLKSIPIVAKDKKIQRRLQRMGIASKRLPCFPDAVIACRQAAYRFPEKKILKFGLRHGAYHFKPFANTKGYNMHTKFFMTSTREVEEGQKKGITVGVATGYPKLDAAFNGTWDNTRLQELTKRAGMNPLKKNILFTATWDQSGISAVSQWYNQLDDFTQLYNVFVTVHPSTSKKYMEVIKKTKNVFFIDDHDVIPYIMLSDVCIGDSSSILAECCALKKPIITFKVPHGKRTVPEVKEIIRTISIQIDGFHELNASIEHALNHPEEKRSAQEKANVIMFDVLDGKAGQRVAEHIIDLLPHLKP